MRKVPYIIILFIIVLVLFPTLRYQVFSFLKPETNISNDKNSDYDLDNSFFDSLITNPQKYENKHITVKGFVQLEFEHCAIYKNELYSKLNSKDLKAFWLNILPSDSLSFSYQNIEFDLRDIDIKSFYKIFNNKFVEIKGTFDPDNKGHFDLYLGSLKNISSIKIYDKPLPFMIM